MWRNESALSPEKMLNMLKAKDEEQGGGGGAVGTGSLLCKTSQTLLTLGPPGTRSDDVTTSTV